MTTDSNHERAALSAIADRLAEDIHNHDYDPDDETFDIEGAARRIETAITTIEQRARLEGQTEALDRAVEQAETYSVQSLNAGIPKGENDHHDGYVEGYTAARKDASSRIKSLISPSGRSLVEKREAEIRAVIAEMEHIAEYWNKCENNTAMFDALYHIMDVAEGAKEKLLALIPDER